jgi:hypothetical protein
MKKKKQGVKKFLIPHNELHEMLRDANQRHLVPPELINLRHRITTERHRTHWNIIERVAREANVDLKPILEDARLRNKAKRRYVTRTIEKLEAEVHKSALEEKRNREKLRKEYLREFGKLYQARAGNPELKFLVPEHWSTKVDPFASCLIGSGCSEPDLGSFAANDEMRASTEIGDLVQLFPSIRTDNGDCPGGNTARVQQHVVYRYQGEIRLFHATSIRIDLWGTGSGSAILGDGDWFTDPNPRYNHTNGWLTVKVYQSVEREGRTDLDGPWIALDRHNLYTRNGDYANTISFDIGADRFPCDIYLRGPSSGGKRIQCVVTLETEAQAMGSDGRVSVDFATDPFGIQLGCICLIGEELS